MIGPVEQSTGPFAFFSRFLDLGIDDRRSLWLDDGMTTTQNTSTDTSIIASITKTDRDNIAESRAARMLTHAIWNYQSASQQVTEFAGYVKKSMETIIGTVADGQRIYGNEVASWHGRLTEAVAERQAAADKITEMSYLLGLDDNTREAMWVEIESEVK